MSEHRQKLEPTNQDIIDTVTHLLSVGEGQGEKKFIDITRIPLICQDITDMKKDIADINDNLKWGIRVVIGAVILGLLTMLIQ